jgi:hypothetical protein
MVDHSYKRAPWLKTNRDLKKCERLINDLKERVRINGLEISIKHQRRNTPFLIKSKRER